MAIYTDAAPSVAGSTIMLTILAFLTYGLRVYCRVTRKSWGMEDWIMTAALVCSPALMAEYPTNDFERYHSLCLWQDVWEERSMESAFSIRHLHSLGMKNMRHRGRG